MIHPYAESRKRARKKWRQSPKGKAWDKAYGQRPEVKERRKEYNILQNHCLNSFRIAICHSSLGDLNVLK